MTRGIFIPPQFDPNASSETRLDDVKVDVCIHDS